MTCPSVKAVAPSGGNIRFNSQVTSPPCISKQPSWIRHFTPQGVPSEPIRIPNRLFGLAQRRANQPIHRDETCDPLPGSLIEDIAVSFVCSKIRGLPEFKSGQALFGSAPAWILMKLSMHVRAVSASGVDCSQAESPTPVAFSIQGKFLMKNALVAGTNRVPGRNNSSSMVFDCVKGFRASRCGGTGQVSRICGALAPFQTRRFPVDEAMESGREGNSPN